MPYCRKCGAELRAEKYCPNCGTYVLEIERRAIETEGKKLFLQENITEMKTIVYVTLVDPSTVKLIGEREKIKLFTRIGMLRPKSGDVQFESIERFYDPHFTISGRYFVDYYRRKTHKLKVEADVSEVSIFNQILKPKTPTLTKLHGKGREVKIETMERIIKENTAYLVLDRKGREVKIKDLPAAPAEEEPEKVLAEAKNRIWRVEMSERPIDIFRSRVISRPDDAERITEELFEVSEQTLVYTPVYQATYKNVRNGRRRSILISGVTSKIEKTI